MTKIAAISIYGKNLYKASLPEPGVYDLKIGMQHLGLKFSNQILMMTFGLPLPILRHGHNKRHVHLNEEHCYKVIQWGKLAANEQINKIFIF